MTTAQYHKHFINQLKTIYEEREATQIAEWVFENITELKKWQIRMGQHEIDAGILGKLNGCLGDLLLHKPVQYVLSEAWFYKRLFFVNENVLIPRPETEDIVARIVEDLQLRNIVYPLILDIGTGSGCIAVSLSKELVESSITAIDVSNGALNVARQNAANLDAVIDFLLIDFLEPKEWAGLKKYDVIVSNPPYIPVKEKASLAKNVISFEPHNALFVPD
ncbi:MAG: HemK/PrmC family methyltransferase, partial [Ginsengibacter sp.]